MCCFHNICELNGDEWNPDWIYHDESSPEDRTAPAGSLQRCTGATNSIWDTLKHYLYSHQ